MKRWITLPAAAALLFMAAMSLSARTYFRNELLDQGRRFTNTLDKYLELSDPEKVVYFKPQALVFPGYRVDTNQGLSSVNVSLISFDGKFSVPDIFSAYAIVHIYDVRSGRKILQVDSTASGLVPARDDKGNTDFGLVKYGLLTEVLAGFDVHLFKFARINVSGIYSHEELNNSVFDTRQVQAIPQFGGVNVYGGDLLYREYSERSSNTFHPVFGLYFFDSLNSMLTWSPSDKKVTAAESVLSIDIGETAGAVTGRYNYYQYWGREHGVRLGMDKIFGFLGFGAEYLARGRYFTDIFIEMKPEFRFTSLFVQIALTFNMARTPETIALRRSALFRPGGRVDVTLGGSAIEQLRGDLFVQLYTVYNYYDTLKLFRGSSETWGIGFAFGLRFNTRGGTEPVQRRLKPGEKPEGV